MRIISLLVLLIFCLPASVTAVETRSSMATQLADHYLKSFAEAATPLPKAHQARKTKASDTDVTDIHLSPRAARAVVFNEIFAQSSYYQDHYEQAGNLLNPYVWKDLHLFCGTTTTPGYHFLSRINKTITVLGEGALASLIAAPIANLERLTKRQQFIAFLCQNNRVYTDLKSELQNYKPSEKAMLSFWTETDPLYAKAYNTYLTGLFYTRSAASNKLAGSLQIKKIWLRDIWNIYGNYIWYPVILGLPLTEISHLLSNVSRGAFYKEMYWIWMPAYNLYHVSKHLSKEAQPLSSTMQFGNYLLPALISILPASNTTQGTATTKSMQGS